MSIALTALYRYPVKGLSAEPLDDVTLAAGAGVPGDRRFALALFSAPLDPASPAWAPREHFLNLHRFPRLAALTTRYDGESGLLTIERDGKRVAAGNLGLPVGRAMIADFLRAYLKDELIGTPRVVRLDDGGFTDQRAPYLHLVNRASLHDLARVTGSAVAPERFRPNLVIDGAEPWAEFDWIGGEMQIGDVRLRVVSRTPRCDGPNAIPGRGEGGENIRHLLQKGYDHMDFGVYTEVISGGRICVGDGVQPPSLA